MEAFILKKAVTVAWKNLCKPVIEGGLSLRSINSAAMLKLSWNVVVSKEDWAGLFRARFFRSGVPALTYIRSSIWPGVKNYM